jgi:anti-sigma factor RsiW
VPDHHISIDELASAGKGLVDPARAAQIEAHIAACSVCQRAAAALQRVGAMLAADAGRPQPWAAPKPTLGSFGSGLPKRSPRRPVGPALTAAAAAAAVGFAGYLISAAAGLNEPPSLSVAIGSELDSAARSIAGSGDLSPHRFSHAWQCALEVIDGRITGLVSVTYEATPALLVYARHQGNTHVAIVTGCEDNRPTVVSSTVLSN